MTLVLKCFCLSLSPVYLLSDFLKISHLAIIAISVPQLSVLTEESVEQPEDISCSSFFLVSVLYTATLTSGSCGVVSTVRARENLL